MVYYRLVTLCLPLLCFSCMGTARLGLVSAMDRNNDLGVKGDLTLGVGVREKRHALFLIAKGSGGLDPVNEEPVGSALAGLEYRRGFRKTGWRIGLYGGPSFSAGQLGARFQASVGIVERFTGVCRRFGGLALDISIGYVPGNLDFSGFWYGIGLIWQYDWFFMER